MRTLTEGKRGCGYRKEGVYLCGEPMELGTLPLVVEVDPPIPVDIDIIPHSRGLYLIDLDAVLTEPCDQWLVGSSKDSKDDRDHRKWEVEQYGMTLHERSRLGLCAGCTPEQMELRLSGLQPFRNVYLSDYILSISRMGRGRRIARETARMQEARIANDYRGLLAACWRLTGYEGQNAVSVRENLKRIMAGIGALEDAVLF